VKDPLRHTHTHTFTWAQQLWVRHSPVFVKANRVRLKGFSRYA
jgi:hypothetical protein